MKLIRCAAPFGALIIAAASVAFLIGVYRWANENNNLADREHEIFIVSAAIACSVLAIPVLGAALVRNVGMVNVVARGAAGAFVAVAASSATTLLIAIAIKDATDPGEFGRPLFRVAYVCALAVSLGIGGTVAWAATAARTHTERLAAGALAFVLTAVAWTYLAIGSSELNTCVVDDEFPLSTDFVCSGY